MREEKGGVSERREEEAVICKYCGSPLKAGETMCGNCGRKQDSMVQMEGFDETLYAGENLVGNRVPDGGPQRYDGGWILTEQEWGRLVHSVQEERRKYRASRRKTFLCMLIVVVINLVLLLTCIWLNFRLAGLEKSVQETISVQEEQQKDESGTRDENVEGTPESQKDQTGGEENGQKDLPQMQQDGSQSDGEAEQI